MKKNFRIFFAIGIEDIPSTRPTWKKVVLSIPVEADSQQEAGDTFAEALRKLVDREVDHG